MMQNIVLGADIGGSHITAALVNIDTKQIQSQTEIRQSVKADAAASLIIEDWCSAFSKLITNHNLSDIKIGLAMPGPFDYAGGISYIKGLSKYESLYGLNVKSMIASKLEISEDQIRLQNDAASFLHGEVLSGAAMGYNDVIGITLGTGIGTARYHDGHAQDADLWKFPYKDSFIEEYVATRWFVKRYHELTGKTIHGVKDLVMLYQRESVVPTIFEEFCQHLADFLTSFVEMDKPQVIVMGGNVSKASDYFMSSLVSRLSEKGVNVPIRKALLEEQAAILGGAYTWLD
jgi:glucokinase